MKNLNVLVVVLCPLLALADSRSDAIADALSQARRAADEAEESSAKCRKKVGAKVDNLVDTLKDMREEATDKQVRRALSMAEDAQEQADDVCTKQVSKPLGRVVAALETASDAKPTAAAPPPSSGTQVDLVGAIGNLFGGASAKTTVRESSTRSTSETHTINGKPVNPHGDDEEAPSRGGSRASSAGGDFGATCRGNNDCANRTCFVGKGNLGYCTKMCDSFSDCPSFWNCKRAANAPQKICMQ